MTDDFNPYEDAGFESRKEYLENLADDYGLPLDHVQALADILGPSEDFDGLISMLNDME